MRKVYLISENLLVVTLSKSTIDLLFPIFLFLFLSLSLVEKLSTQDIKYTALQTSHRFIHVNFAPVVSLYLSMSPYSLCVVLLE